jgi:hypothetical protein
MIEKETESDFLQFLHFSYFFTPLYTLISIDKKTRKM